MIRLAPNGIFPIKFDAKGKELESAMQTGLSFPGTIQGEGKLAGVTSLFIRFWGCNLDCTWTNGNKIVDRCDTQEAIDNKENSLLVSVEEIVETIQQNRFECDHIVITGGEPFLQKEGLLALVKQLKELQFHITIESNASIYSEAVLNYTDLLSLSPKLQSAFGNREKESERNRERVRGVIQQSVKQLETRNADFQLKFVVSEHNELAEIRSLLSDIKEVTKDDILLMPMGGTMEQQQHTMSKAIAFAIETGWRFAPRLHVLQWGDKRGV